MQKRLIQWLICLSCHENNFTCHVFVAGEQRDSVEEGLLRCGCGASYPIIHGVVRVMPPNMQGLIRETYPEFFQEYQDQLDLATAPEATLAGVVSRTARSFGYEWNEFWQLRPHYEQNFWHYFEAYPRNYFEGRLILDAGCGTGRHVYYASRYGAEVVGVDFSSAIDVAYRNNQDNPQTHFVQADIYHLPFKQQAFDLVCSIGVLHHLPDPQGGFESLLHFVKPEGDINIYVYHKPSSPLRRLLLSLVTGARMVTTRMPHPMLKYLSVVIAIAAYSMFVIPTKVLGRMGLDGLGASLPLHSYARSSFQALYKDTFDRFSAPIENRYSREEIEEWFSSAHLSITRVLGGTGWRVSGIRPANGG